MSYCRWSSDDFGCDIYAYEHVGGFYRIHIANNRVEGDVPKMPPWPAPGEDVTAWASEAAAAHKRQMDFLASATFTKIDHPLAGETFDEPTLEAFYHRMLVLRDEGFHFPDYVLDAIREEIAAEKTH